MAEDLFARLSARIREQNEEGDLPDFIVPALREVAEHPEVYGDRLELVASLLLQVDEYETYSNTCCEKIGFDTVDLYRTLEKLGVERRPLSLPTLES